MNLPDFYAAAPVVPTRDGLAELLGASPEGRLDYGYADVVRLAGHSCPTVAGAFLMARAALAALYPEGPAERGAIRIRMPAPADHGTTGVTAQVLTLVTGAAAENGFHGIAGRHVRAGLLEFADRVEGDAIVFTRTDTGQAVQAQLDVSTILSDAGQRDRLLAILDDSADAETRAEFAQHWQERVRRLLLEFADDPRVIRISPVAT